MKRYKGYYIDGVIFTSEEDIDIFCRDSLIEKIKIFHHLLFDMPEGHYNTADKLALVNEIHNREIRLHDEYNMSWEDIELIPYK